MELSCFDVNTVNSVLCRCQRKRAVARWRRCLRLFVGVIQEDQDEDQEEVGDNIHVNADLRKVAVDKQKGRSQLQTKVQQDQDQRNGQPTRDFFTCPGPQQLHGDVDWPDRQSKSTRWRFQGRTTSEKPEHNAEERQLKLPEGQTGNDDPLRYGQSWGNLLRFGPKPYIYIYIVICTRCI